MTGSSFSISVPCWTTSPSYTRGSFVSVHLWYFPCSHAFLIHASTSCLINAALILPWASLQLLKHSCSSWEMYTGWNAGCLGAHVLKGGRTQLGALPHSFSPELMEPGHLLSQPRCPELNLIPHLCWEEVAICEAGRCLASSSWGCNEASHVPQLQAH